jgi:PAS domain S-box-containing protein
MGSETKGPALQRGVSTRWLLVRTALVSLCGMVAFEMLKEFIFRGRPFTRWQSHIITILLGSIMATAAALFMDRKLSSESRFEHERLNTFLEHIPDCVYFKDGDSRFVRLSRSLASYFGLDDAAQALNRTDFDFFSSEHAEQAFADEQEIIRSGQSMIEKEEKETWPDGRETWALTTKVPLRDRQGQIIGTMGISHNITDRKRAERELQEYKAHLEELVEARTKELSRTNEQLKQDICARERAEEALHRAEARYRILVEELPAVAYVAEPGEAGAWLYVSPKIESMLGFSPAEWKADRQLWFRQIHPEDREGVLAKEKGSVARGEALHFEYRMFARDGRVVWIHDGAALAPDVPGGRPLHHGVLLDISERKRAEQELAGKVEELARSNADLEKFAYVASHDLQEPLRMVASYTQLLARRYKGKLDTDADEFIGFAVDGAARMQTLIQDLLSYSRVTTEGKSLHLTDAKAACNAALENLQTSIKDSNAVVNAGPLPAVLADATQLTQLFQNLIGNAVKYRNERRPEICVAAKPNGDEWSFSVQDNGIGIEPQYSERIFQMFQRLHTREEYSGTGIGLAICRKIVERHGGRIWVESQPGQGSTFLFTIPRAEGAET